MINHFEPPAFALDWCRRLSASSETLERLEGGINNAVFRCRAGRHWFVLKGYPEHSDPGNDRLKAEVEFLNYAQLVAPEFVPRLLYSDVSSRSVVMEYLEGVRFEDGTHPQQEDIDEATAFLRCLNIDLVLARKHMVGSATEGFLRLTEHLQNIEQRLEIMRTEHLPANMRNKAKNIIERVSQRLADLQESAAETIARGYCEDRLNFNERCVSPSDFGFHNAIRTQQGIKFYDFEFSGWDDPAKAVADFDLQPRVRVNTISGAIISALPEWHDGLAVRHKILFPILELKWACIILAVLNPCRWAQMSFIDTDHAPEAIIQAKIQLAQTYLPKD